ncbi:MAG TPA: carboxylating nicotinate-nucleotide diphosphorylase [Nocardioides sp.]|nr:carboxylating nicotinate-nucleotide diphosphorylase [Nocardioides sp.]
MSTTTSPPSGAPSDVAGAAVPAPAAADVARAVAIALAEDRSADDVTTSATVPRGCVGRAEIVAREAGVVAGLPVADAVFRHALGDVVEIGTLVGDGGRVATGQVLMTVRGDVACLLGAERSALNLLGHLSGIATATAAWVDAVADFGVTVRDTRKTTAGLRALEKYAVRCGGGVNHRLSLGDQALIKENHILAAGSAAGAFEEVRARHPDVPVQVEVQTLDELTGVLRAGATSVMLDNMSFAEMREAVRLTRGRARLEASGRLRLADARRVASTGVDSVAIGELTHSARALDVSMRLVDLAEGLP